MHCQKKRTEAAKIQKQEWQYFCLSGWKVLRKGHVDSMIVWTSQRVYVGQYAVCLLWWCIQHTSHKSMRLAPTTASTMSDIENLLKTAAKQDCMHILGVVILIDKYNVMWTDAPANGVWGYWTRWNNARSDGDTWAVRSGHGFQTETNEMGCDQAEGTVHLILWNMRRGGQNLDCVSNRWKSMVKNV